MICFILLLGKRGEKLVLDENDDNNGFLYYNISIPQAK